MANQPKTVLLNHLDAVHVLASITRPDPAGDVVVVASYNVTDQNLQYPQGRTIPVTPTAPQLASLNALWTALINFINNLEGTT